MLLAARSVEVKGDWLLDQGPDYWDQLVQLIRQSDAFIALISPDITASEPCGKEIELAAALGKRILPIVVADVGNPKALPSVLQSPQWAFLRENDNFEFEVERIVRSIYSDFADMQEHTQLLLAADRW